MTQQPADERIHVAMVSTFGPQVRGVSPYSDYLAGALDNIPQVDLQRVDFKKLYPEMLYPSAGRHRADNGWQQLHYARPSTWNSPLEHKPDVIHIQYWTPITAHMLRGIANRAARMGRKTLLTVHNPSPHETILPLRPIERRLLREVDHVIVHTEGGADIVVSSGAKPRNEISVIPHGAPVRERSSFIERSDDDYRAADLNPDRRYVLYFGNIREYKGVDLLLQAWPRVAAQHPDVDLIVAGRVWQGGSLVSRLASHLLGTYSTGRQISELASRGEPKQTIYRLGFIENEMLFSLCRIAELAIFPYRRFDAQSGAATMVGSLGVPMIVSPQGGLSSLAIDSSYVCDPFDPESLAETISRHLNSQTTDSRHQQREQLERIDWTPVAQQHFELYREILKR